MHRMRLMVGTRVGGRMGGIPCQMGVYLRVHGAWGGQIESGWEPCRWYGRQRNEQLYVALSTYSTVHTEGHKAPQ